MSERRMDAYYYEFEPTKNVAIDKILGAVACAGKAYHHTQDWCDIANQYDDHTGVTPIEWIQNAAFEAADEIERLRAEIERLRKALAKIAQYDMQAVAMDALQPGERIRPTEKKFRDALVEISTLAGDPSAYWTAREALGEEKK